MATCSSCGLTFTSRKQLGAHRRRCARAGNNSDNGYGDAAIAPVITTAVHAPDEAPLPSLQQIVRRNPAKWGCEARNDDSARPTRQVNDIFVRNYEQASPMYMCIISCLPVLPAKYVVIKIVITVGHEKACCHRCAYLHIYVQKRTSMCVFAHLWHHICRCNNCGANTFPMLAPVAQNSIGLYLKQCKDKTLSVETK